MTSRPAAATEPGDRPELQLLVTDEPDTSDAVGELHVVAGAARLLVHDLDGRPEDLGSVLRAVFDGTAEPSDYTVAISPCVNSGGIDRRT
jgi:hypothetical protein